MAWIWTDIPKYKKHGEVPRWSRYDIGGDVQLQSKKRKQHQQTTPASLRVPLSLQFPVKEHLAALDERDLDKLLEEGGAIVRCLQPQLAKPEGISKALIGLSLGELLVSVSSTTLGEVASSAPQLHLEFSYITSHFLKPILAPGSSVQSLVLRRSALTEPALEELIRALRSSSWCIPTISLQGLRVLEDEDPVEASSPAAAAGSRRTRQSTHTGTRYKAETLTQQRWNTLLDGLTVAIAGGRLHNVDLRDCLSKGSKRDAPAIKKEHVCKMLREGSELIDLFVCKRSLRGAGDQDGANEIREAVEEAVAGAPRRRHVLLGDMLLVGNEGAGDGEEPEAGDLVSFVCPLLCASTRWPGRLEDDREGPTEDQAAAFERLAQERGRAPAEGGRWVRTLGHPAQPAHLRDIVWFRVPAAAVRRFAECDFGERPKLETIPLSTRFRADLDAARQAESEAGSRAAAGVGPEAPAEWLDEEPPSPATASSDAEGGSAGPPPPGPSPAPEGPAPLELDDDEGAPPGPAVPHADLPAPAPLPAHLAHFPAGGNARPRAPAPAAPPAPAPAAVKQEPAAGSSGAPAPAPGPAAAFPWREAETVQLVRAGGARPAAPPAPHARRAAGERTMLRVVVEGCPATMTEVEKRIAGPPAEQGADIRVFLLPGVEPQPSPLPPSGALPPGCPPHVVPIPIHLPRPGGPRVKLLVWLWGAPAPLFCEGSMTLPGTEGAKLHVRFEY